MKLDIKDNCPINGFNPCKKLECAWFIQLRGTDPNSGKDIDEWGCAVAFTPTLLIENALQSRQTGAAVESFRNEMVRANEKHMDILLSKDTNIIEIASKKQRNLTP